MHNNCISRGLESRSRPRSHLTNLVLCLTPLFWADCGDKCTWCHLQSDTALHRASGKEEKSSFGPKMHSGLSFSSCWGCTGGARWGRKERTWWLHGAYERGISPYPRYPRSKYFSVPPPWGMLCAFPWTVGARPSPKRENAGSGEERGTAGWQRA